MGYNISGIAAWVKHKVTERLALLPADAVKVLVDLAVQLEDSDYLAYQDRLR